MISRTVLPSRHRRALLNSIAFSCLLSPVDGWSQSANPSQTLDPEVVQPSAAPPNARSTRRGTAAHTARLRQQRNVATSSGTPLAALSGPVFAAPTLNLAGTSTAGSRLGLTRLQTPASVEVISAICAVEVNYPIRAARSYPWSYPPGNGHSSHETSRPFQRSMEASLEIAPRR